MTNEHERTLSFANFALEQIKSLRQPATPRNYEIWYVYAAAYNSTLNAVVNETLSRTGKLSDSDLQLIYDTYLSPARATDRLDEVGSRVMHELDAVMAVVSDALGLGHSFSDALEGADRSLAEVGDREQLRVVVETLVRTTHDMRAANETLEGRLTASRREISGLHENLEAIRAESLTDPLTSLGNRKYFDRAISAAIGEAKRLGEPLSVLMLDIDHFKAFNDTYGHLTGDQVLRLVGMSLKQTVKGQDTAARYGGEEFAVVLPNTGLRQAKTVGEHIRHAVMSRELKKKSTGEILGRVTVSVGIALMRPSDDADSLIERADTSLYAAKRAGRNCVVLESDPPPAVSHRVA
jgi:diguanylate cyclase